MLQKHIFIIHHNRENYNGFHIIIWVLCESYHTFM